MLALKSLWPGFYLNNKINAFLFAYETLDQLPLFHLEAIPS